MFGFSSKETVGKVCEKALSFNKLYLFNEENKIKNDSIFTFINGFEKIPYKESLDFDTNCLNHEKNDRFILISSTEYYLSKDKEDFVLTYYKNGSNEIVTLPANSLIHVRINFLRIACNHFSLVPLINPIYLFRLSARNNTSNHVKNDIKCSNNAVNLHECKLYDAGFLKQNFFCYLNKH